MIAPCHNAGTKRVEDDGVQQTISSTQRVTGEQLSYFLHVVTHCFKPLRFMCRDTLKIPAKPMSPIAEQPKAAETSHLLIVRGVHQRDIHGFRVHDQYL